jgi:hypothetical protein
MADVVVEQYCSVGALSKVCSYKGQNTLRYLKAQAALEVVVDGMSVTSFNDTHFHAEVMAMFDAAIARA